MRLTTALHKNDNYNNHEGPYSGLSKTSAWVEALAAAKDHMQEH